MARWKPGFGQLSPVHHVLSEAVACTSLQGGLAGPKSSSYVPGLCEVPLVLEGPGPEVTCDLGS